MFQSQRRLVLSLCGILFIQPVFSNTNKSPALITWLKSSFVVTLSGGPGWVKPGQTQTLTLAPEIIKTYTANKPTDGLAQGDLFLGVKAPLSTSLQGQIGLDLGIAGSAKLSGDIWDDADPSFNNYTYKYKIQHRYVALKGKLLGTWNLPVIPWVSAAIGAGNNKAYSFYSTPSIEEAVATPRFASHTITAFTYTLGIGLQRQLNQHWQVGLGYEFADWGKSRLGSMPDSSTNASLSLSHLYANSLLFNVTFLT